MRQGEATMAMDMPPPVAVEYRIERPAAGVPDRALSPISGAVAQARRDSVRTADRLPSADAILPRIDPRSSALTQDDRRAIVSGMDASRAGRLGQGVQAPDGYVGDRVRLAALRVDAMERSVQGRLVAQDAHAVRCRTIAVALDRRAGAYVEGGEIAAERARRAIPARSVEECREIIAQRGRAPSAAEVAHSRPVSPGRDHGAGPVRTSPDAVRRQAVGVDPRVVHRDPVRVDPEAGRRQAVSVDLRIPRRDPVRIDPQASHALQFRGREG